MDDRPADAARRRRRRGPRRVQGAPQEAPVSKRGPSPPPGGERGLRDIVGAGHSQLGVSGALRARDVNRPTDDDLAAAEREVVVVRRNWRPDERG